MSQRYKVVFIYTPDREVSSLIRPALPEDFDLIYVDPRRESELNDALASADFVITFKLTCEQIARAPHLRMVQLHGVGYDDIDLQALKERGIPLAATVPGTVEAVAEHTILLILSLYKRLLDADRSLREGRWVSQTLRTRCYLLQGKTVGIIGLGRIGRLLARRLRPFDTTLIYTDIVDPGREVEQALGVQRVTQAELLRTADIVSVHVPLTSVTRKFMGAPEFAAMKREAIFINTSRGPVVDEAALYEALVEKQILGAALDVFDPEPPRPDNPLWQLDSIVVTPHMAAGTRDSLAIKARVQFGNFQRHLRGEPVLDLVTE